MVLLLCAQSPMACDLHYLKSRPLEPREQMLRITVQESENSRTVLLEGKVVGLWVEEFDRTWHSLEPSLGSKKLQIDLRGVSYVDARGRRLLQEIYRKVQAHFVADSPLTQYFADEAMQPTSRHEQEGV
jgi:ABC-type transporter Mla MlaB component